MALYKCPKCRYPFSTIGDVRCSECGLSLNAANLDAFVSRRLRIRIKLLSIASFLTSNLIFIIGGHGGVTYGMLIVMFFQAVFEGPFSSFLLVGVLAVVSWASFGVDLMISHPFRVFGLLIIGQLCGTIASIVFVSLSEHPYNFMISALPFWVVVIVTLSLGLVWGKTIWSPITSCQFRE